MRNDQVGLAAIAWCGAWALGSLAGVSYFGDLTLVGTAGVAVRAFLWAIPIGLIVFGLLTQTQILKTIPARWIAAAWIVTSVIAGIPDMTGGYDDTEVCYDRQGAYSC